MIPLLLAGPFLLTWLALACGFRAARSDSDLTIDNALRRSPLLVAISLLLSLIGMAAVGMELSDRFCQFFALLVQQYSTWISWLALASLFAVISGYGLALAIFRGHKQTRSLLVAILLVQIALGLLFVRLFSPIGADLGPGVTTDGGVVLQTHGSTCVAASLANVSRHFDIDLDEKEAADLLLTTVYGTGPGQVRFVLDQLGFSFTTLDPKQRSLADVSPPAILFVDHPALGRESHAVMYHAIAEGGYEIYEPLEGAIIWDQQTLEARWHGNGIACTRP
ncbi:MAG: cysteine peptidase family C39 domain-containing protein [Planctomycetota bacterium]|nr:cysteine peptidase family C39 domain-containing protein [Planctomycetota bacterium]